MLITCWKLCQVPLRRLMRCSVASCLAWVYQGRWAVYRVHYGDRAWSVLKQSSQSIGRDSISITNFGENELQFLIGHFLTSTNVVQDLLQIRQNNSVFRILRSGDDFLLESSWSTLRVTVMMTRVLVLLFHTNVCGSFPSSVGGTYLAIRYSCITCWNFRSAVSPCVERKRACTALTRIRVNVARAIMVVWWIASSMKWSCDRGMPMANDGGRFEPGNNDATSQSKQFLKILQMTRKLFGQLISSRCELF